MKGYKRLMVWQRVHELILLIYEDTKKFPAYEQFGLTSQIRRAAVSIGANLVEGQASNSKKDFLNFLNIANRSLVETEYLLEIASDLKYLASNDYLKLDQIRGQIGALLNGLIRSIRDKL